MCHFFEWLTPGIVAKLRPFRAVFLIISVISILFALLIIVENVLFIAMQSNQSIILLLVPYGLSWLLVIFGYLFGRFALLLHRRSAKCVTVQPRIAMWSDSRPGSPAAISVASTSEATFLNISHSSFPCETPSSPFFISSNRPYVDEPPSYEQVMARASPIPPDTPV